MRLIIPSLALLSIFTLAAGPTQDLALPIENRQTDLTLVGSAKNEKGRQRTWADAVNERVAAEGLAWGAGEKGLGQRVILDGAHIYVKGKELPAGKLVRVVGTLRLAKMDAAPVHSQGYGSPFRYFFIEAERVETISEVRTPKVALVNDRK